MYRKLWTLAEYNKDLAAALAEKCGIDPFTALILNSRGCVTAEDVESFLCVDSEMESPFALEGMREAVDCINAAIDGFERICVFGDYDADGVTATALMFSYLDAQGANVSYYIPSRMTEGYGLSVEAVEKLAADGTKLIITVDNGISAIDAAERAYELGMKIVITDHHRPGAALPKAAAVINPRREDDKSRFKELAGVGVALKLAAALEGGSYEALLDDYADIVVIGTIADIVPLTGENRILTIRGLEALNETFRCGIAVLKEKAGIADKELDSVDVTYTLAPRINAAGRMGSADRALRLLLTDDYDEAAALAEEINEVNLLRHETERAILEKVEGGLAQNPERRLDKILVVDGDDWHQGVIGIVASRLCEKYGRPAIVISRDTDGTGRGSGRSTEGFSLFDALRSLSGLLIYYGGHTLASGFKIDIDKIEAFRTAINEYALEMPDIVPRLRLDFRLHPAKINTDILEILQRIGPFGAGNPPPLFGLYNMEIKVVKSVGGGKHVIISAVRGDTYINAVKFGALIDKFAYKPGDVVDLAVRLEKNEYRGAPGVSIQIREIRFSGTDDGEMINGFMLYEKIKRGQTLSTESLRSACPDRALIGAVYRYVKQNAGRYSDAEVLAYRLKLNLSDICRVLVSLDALCELGILHQSDDGTYNIPEMDKKMDLFSSSILKKVGYTG